MIQSNYYPNLIVFSNLFILCVWRAPLSKHMEKTVGATVEDKKAKKKIKNREI